jgi:hypothetical protein
MVSYPINFGLDRRAAIGDPGQEAGQFLAHVQAESHFAGKFV